MKITQQHLEDIRRLRMTSSTNLSKLYEIHGLAKSHVLDAKVEKNPLLKELRQELYYISTYKSNEKKRQKKMK